MRQILSLAFTLVVGISFGQFGLAQTENAYQSSANPHYWKQRKPHAAYWQQDVHYMIKATVDDQEESVAGDQRLIYTNNSPDTLYEVFFHLYQNAFTPNSYAHQLRKAGQIPTHFGEHEAKGVGTRIDHFSIDGEIVSFSLDNTILRAKLKQPLLPGGELRFDIHFTTYWDKDDGGNMRRRMKTFRHSGIKHFDGVHWYPRICVYDRKFGWTTDQHLGKEFYGDFGLFEVELTFPNQYIVEATGNLINESQVLPPALREAIDLKNYKTSRSILTEPVKADGSTKTWKYSAMNVHDFAFTADPTYRIGEVVVNGVRCIALAQEQNAHRWQQTASFVGQVIDTYSKDFGTYIYPKMVAADARDGMEYPMLTLNGGNWPGHQYVIAHEVGHNWFFGMVGNNETYRSALDEGFTQFLTAWSLKKINNQDFYGNPVDKQVVFNRYLMHAVGTNNATLNVHADHYNSAERHGGGYGMVYFKTASMLYNLQYVLGDELFLDAMQHYFGQWKTCHPYWDDFKTSIIQYTHVDLNWFFDQWITTTLTIDYAVEGVKREGEYNHITLKRKGGMQMPIDVRVEYADGSTEDHYIPNTYFTKKTDAEVHTPWIGWGMLNTSYAFHTKKGLKVKDVVIDPSERLADIYRLDNRKHTAKHIQFSKYRAPQGNFDRYEMQYHPLVWYNAVDGLKIGAELMGNYAAYKHQFKLGLWYNSGLGGAMDGHSPIAYQANYSTQTGIGNRVNLHSSWMDGLNHHGLGWERKTNKTTYTISFKSLYRNGALNKAFLIYPEQWNASQFNNFIELGSSRDYNYFKGHGNWAITTRASALYSDYRYASISGEWKNVQAVKKTSLRTRIFAQHMTGEVAPESQLMLAGANSEAFMNDPWLRSRGFVPSSWEGMADGFGHLHKGGGLNLRGFSGYRATNSNDQEAYYIFAGNSGAAVNVEWDFNRLLDPFTGQQGLLLNTYAFADAGVLYSGKNNSGLRVDAGLGTALTIRTQSVNYFQPVTVRLDLPFFVNRLPSGQSDYFGFRYILGISRAF